MHQACNTSTPPGGLWVEILGAGLAADAAASRRGWRTRESAAAGPGAQAGGRSRPPRPLARPGAAASAHAALAPRGNDIIQ